MSIFEGQTLLKITQDAGQDISTASVLEIKYLKPVSQTTGVWVATLSPTDNNKAFYDVVTGDLDEKGKWKVQLYVTMGVGIVPGKISTIEVLEPLVVIP